MYEMTDSNPSDAKNKFQESGGKFTDRICKYYGNQT